MNSISSANASCTLEYIHCGFTHAVHVLKHIALTKLNYKHVRSRDIHETVLITLYVIPVTPRMKMFTVSATMVGQTPFVVDIRRRIL